MTIFMSSRAGVTDLAAVEGCEKPFIIPDRSGVWYLPYLEVDLP